MIVQVLTARKNKGLNAKEMIIPPAKDIIVTKTIDVEEEKEDGTRIIKKQKTKVNITKKVNETAKLIKNKTAEEKLAELEKVFTQN